MAPSGVKGDALNASQGQYYRTATPVHYMHCDSSLLLPLHLAIIKNEFLIMFLPIAT